MTALIEIKLALPKRRRNCPRRFDPQVASYSLGTAAYCPARIAKQEAAWSCQLISSAVRSVAAIL
jgi:hypothetical protein